MSDDTPILAPAFPNDPNFVDLTGQERTDFLAQQDADNLRMLRHDRDVKLKETDWWASSDLTMTAAQSAYRQALRDTTTKHTCLLYTSPSPRDGLLSRMPSSA